MDLDEYQRLTLRTARNGERPQSEALNEWTLGLIGETCELVEHIKKVNFHGHGLDVGLIREEAGDTLWYLAVLANEVGLSLSEIAEFNIGKTRERYPGGFSEHASRNRKEYQNES